MEKPILTIKGHNLPILGYFLFLSVPKQQFKISEISTAMDQCDLPREWWPILRCEVDAYRLACRDLTKGKKNIKSTHVDTFQKRISETGDSEITTEIYQKGVELKAHINLEGEEMKGKLGDDMHICRIIFDKKFKEFRIIFYNEEIKQKFKHLEDEFRRRYHKYRNYIDDEWMRWFLRNVALPSIMALKWTQKSPIYFIPAKSTEMLQKLEKFMRFIRIISVLEGGGWKTIGEIRERTGCKHLEILEIVKKLEIQGKIRSKLRINEGLRSEEEYALRDAHGSCGDVQFDTFPVLDTEAQRERTALMIRMRVMPEIDAVLDELERRMFEEGGKEFITPKDKKRLNKQLKEIQRKIEVFEGICRISCTPKKGHVDQLDAMATVIRNIKTKTKKRNINGNMKKN